MEEPTIAAIGLGNVLLGDEGLGIHAVRRLRDRVHDLPVRCLDGGTMGIALLPFLRGAAALLFLDAVRGEEEPGSIIELGADELLGRLRLRTSAHDVSLTDLLALLRLVGDPLPERIHFLGMVPQSFRLSTELTPAVEKSLPELLERAAAFLRDCVLERQRVSLGKMPCA